MPFFGKPFCMPVFANGTFVSVARNLLNYYILIASLENFKHINIIIYLSILVGYILHNQFIYLIYVVYTYSDSRRVVLRMRVSELY